MVIKSSLIVLCLAASGWCGSREYAVYNSSFSAEDLNLVYNGELPQRGVKKMLFWKDRKVETAELSYTTDDRYSKLKVRPSNEDEEDGLRDLERQGKIYLISSDESVFDPRIGGHVSRKWSRSFPDLEPKRPAPFFVERSTPSK